jgi:hypothetical protein
MSLNNWLLLGGVAAMAVGAALAHLLLFSVGFKPLWTLILNT